MGNESERRRPENDEPPPRAEGADGAEGTEGAVRVPLPRTDPAGVSDAVPGVGEAVPSPRTDTAGVSEAVPGVGEAVPLPRTEPAGVSDAVAAAREAVPLPRMDPAGVSDAVPAAREADWWRVDADAGFDGTAVPGFHGGVEIPELLRPPAPDEDGEGEAEETERTAEAADEAAEGGEVARRSLRARLGSPLLLVAALLLLAGAAGGWLLALAAGWLLAYASRERRAAVLTLPGLAASAGAVWLWGRVDGRWGEPVAAGGEAMGAALSETWPWTLRGAAIASGLYLLWRSRRG